MLPSFDHCNIQMSSRGHNVEKALLPEKCFLPLIFPIFWCFLLGLNVKGAQITLSYQDRLVN